ncbi:MAG: GHKL domain-containing protein [Eubacteriales bacterium]|nr:GHKL domain-containing protein [Eubacteriales bacterium]
MVSVLLLSGGIVGVALIGLQIPYALYAYRMFFIFVALTGYTFVVFKDKPGKIVLAAGMMYLDNIICEIILLAAFPNVGSSTDWIKTLSEPERVQMLVFYSIILGTLLFLTARLFSRKSSRLTTKEWLLFALFPLSQAMLLCLWFLSAQSMSPTMLAVWQIVSGCICIVVDISLYMIIRGISQRAELKVQNEMLEKQIAMQKLHYVKLSEQYQRIQMLRHDIANHMHTIQILLKSKEFQEARSYSSEILQLHTFQSSLGQCENPIIDAFISSRVEDAKNQQMPIDIDICLPYQLSISDPELVTVFGNLLDNAIEANLNLPIENRYIRIAAATKDGFLAIRMENSLPQASHAEKATRIEGIQRGLGFHILESIAKQYQGNFISYSENGLFISAITLRLDGDPQ